MWFGTGSGVARFADGVWAAYTLGDQKRIVESLHQTRDGTLWAYAQDNRLYRFDDAQWRAVEIPLPGPGHGTSRIHGTKEDVLYLTGVRAARFDYGGMKWASYRDISAWDTSIEGAPYQDPEGRLWFRHMSGGAAVFDGKDWKTFLEVEGPAHRTPQGVLWCGGKGGIRSFDGRTWRTYSGVLDTLWTITQGRDGRLWFTGKRGDRSAVACYDGVDWKTYAEDALARWWRPPTEISGLCL
jgi:streptogramin lyase